MAINIGISFDNRFILTGSASLKDAISIIILQANGISISDVAPLLDMLQTMLSRSSWRLVEVKFCQIRSSLRPCYIRAVH